MNSILNRLLIISFLLISLPLQAYDSVNIVKGTVGAVGVVTTEDGDPKLVEYDSTGSYIQELAEYNDLDKIRILSAESYKALYRLAMDLKEANPGSRLMSREQFDAHSFNTRTKEPEAVTKPDLLQPEDTRSLLIVDEKKLLIPKPEYEGLIVQEFPIDLSPGNGQELGEEIVSVLINKDGGIEYQSQFDIGYKVDIFEREDDGTYKLDERGFRIPIYPLAQVPLIAGDIDTLPFGGSATDKDGKYVLPYAILPCPGFYYEIKAPISAKIAIKNFNPKGDSSHYIRTAMRWDYASCVGYGDLPIGMNLAAIGAQLAAQAIVATLSKPVHNLDLWFATMQLAAKGELKNNENSEVLLQDTTEYRSEDTAIEKLPTTKYTFDFDGDEKIDTIRINPDDDKKIDIWLGEKKPENDDGSRNPPDLTRLADYELLEQLKDQGLLKSITQEHLEDTDIYIYRTSTNQLIGEVEGLNSPDDDTTDAVKTGRTNSTGLVYQGVHEDEPVATFSFASLLIGSVSADFTSSFRTEEGSRRRPWLPSEGQAAEFNNDKKPDFLRPGEIVKVVAINRATGYIGTKEIRLAETYSEGEGLRQHEIELGPPNLKVIATRTYKDEAGLTKDKRHENQLIGSEGAGLTSDEYVKIQTIWLDKDGTPLPDNMPGYTARLAISTGDGTSGFSENFEVKPGFQTEFIQLNNGADLETEHFYVQVVGENFDGNPTFESPGAGEGKLLTRPKKYVPIKVPIYNEQATYESQKALIKARQEEVEDLPDDVQPIYHWVYRPEMQFSVYELKVNEIRQQLNATETETFNIYPAGTDDDDSTVPVISSSYDITQILYELTGKESDQLLPLFGPDRELIFAIGEQEANVTSTVNQNGELTFENIDHLGELAVEDFLSIRLYQNNDSFNTLWEFAFEYLALDTRLIGFDIETDETIYVSADDPVLPFQSILVGYANRKEEDKDPRTINWSIEGQGSVDPQTETNSDTGVFPVDVTMPTTVGAKGTLVAKVGTGSDIETRSKIIEVIAGKPASIDIQVNGQAVVLEQGELTVNVTVKDLHGNMVQDGTDVVFSVTDDALISAYEVETVGGRATATITGNVFPSDIAQLTVSSGDVTQTETFNIAPLTVQLSTVSDVNVRQDVTVTATVTTPDGSPVNNVDITFSSSMGRMQQNEVTTNSSGVAQTQYFSGLRAGQSEITARAAYSGGTRQSITITNPANTGMDVDNAFIVGDASIDGSVTYTRYDITPVSMDYKASGSISINSLADTTISIGDIADPNRAPLIAFHMNELETNEANTYSVIDEVGLNHGTTALNTEIASEQFLGGGKSYRFNGFGQIKVTPNTILNPMQSVGFRFDLKSSSDSQSSILLDHGSAAHRVTLSNNSITYSIRTSDGDFSVTSAAITQNLWHTIAGRYHNGQLELSVDGVLTATPVTGTIAWGIGGIELAKNYTGLMNSFKLFDWNSAPLITFDDASTEKTLTAGTANVVLQSTGQMNALTGSALTTQRVAIKAGDNSNYISLISTEGFKAIGSEYMDTYARNAPVIAMNNLLPSATSAYAQLPVKVLDFIIPPAQAAPWDSWSEAWDAVKEAASWLIPYEDFKNLGEQLYYLATGDNRFSARELTFAALGVATIIPLMKPLKPLLTPLKRFITRYGDKPIIKALGGVLGRAVSEAVKGRTEKLLSLLPYLLIVAELVTDPEGLDTLLMLVDSVASAEDLWVWIEYLTLPTEGWFGNTPPPVEATALLESGVNINPMDFLIPSAYAASFRAKRIAVAKLKNLRKALKEIAHKFDDGNFDGLVPSIRNVTEAMKTTSFAEVRKLLHDPRTLTTAVAAGGVAIRKLLKKTNNLRISPLAFMAIITYIETRRGNCEGIPGCKEFIPEVSDKISTLYGLAFLNALSADKDYVGKRENGAMFHLAMLAVKHLSYEGGNDDSKVVGIEEDRDVHLYMKKGVTYTAFIKPPAIPLKRRVDIVLRGDEASDSLGPENTWVEVKSLKGGYSDYLKYWKPWNMQKSTYSGTRQFYLDRVAISENDLDGVDPDHFPQAKQFEWWMQEFKRKPRGRTTIRSLNDIELSKIRQQMIKLPKGNGGMEYVSLGKKDAAAAKVNISFANTRVKHHNLKNWLLNEGRNLLQDLGDDVIDELVNNAPEF